MNEDQQYDAAEREMDLYRAEVTRITAERDDYAARLKATDESRAEVAAERDGAYRERARLVAFLAACYPSEMTQEHEGDPWPVIYVLGPTGQMSWHIARDDLGLFDHVGWYGFEPQWDGHTTEQKYERLAELIPHATDDRGQLANLRAAVDALTKVTKSHERVMFAAGIDIRRGQPGAARLLLGEQLGGWDGMPPWDGTETGAEYLERTGGGPPDD